MEDREKNVKRTLQLHGRMVMLYTCVFIKNDEVEVTIADKQSGGQAVSY